MPIIPNKEKEIPKNLQSLNSPNSNPQKPSGLVNILGALLPFAPLAYEQFTGQKIPPMTGTLAEMNTALSQLTLNLTQVLNNQQQLWTKLESLEKQANQQLANLTGQVQQIQSIRLSHTRERKEIELPSNYNPRSEEENKY